MKCKQCGHEIKNKENNFCPYCGTPIAREKSRRHIKIVIVLVVCLAVLLAAVVLDIDYFKKVTTVPEASIGDTIEFGSYEQDNDISDGQEPIEWLVLEKEDDRALVISRYCLDYVSFDTGDVSVAWDNSSLRNWLNSDFLEDAFTHTERRSIKTHRNENPGLYMGMDSDGSWIVTNTSENVSDILYQAPASNVTEDQIFLPTVDEAVQFLDSEVMGYPSLTAYAKEKFIQASMEMAIETGFTDEDLLRERYKELEEEYGEGCCYWWLRSPSYSEDTACVIVYGGDVVQAQNVSEKAAIRPVMWLQMD